mmetsp:Transcript_65583/g.77661  ORF Transcript_65583/g.77661 Transcript_65583/m.77661 type:complete len:292 (-) Transcript_65583:194-1069(-)|eukprot:CAMPEP_0172499138 /NCGR_PEP_ID=MMETSP1066-20121228/122734_1 /TAXON_ID=671091 /ORGANISM="Coscinodiscus wailesii, Strain CCMP2513" /LENGTH=291 /DNA_ID=CAMNT_0013272729 /DNA_START=52 /DNA_END=927 /DNA_ORIENTATION=+
MYIEKQLFLIPIFLPPFVSSFSLTQNGRVGNPFATLSKFYGRVDAPLNQATEASVTEEVTKENEPKSRACIKRPKIHWTVPGMNLSYRDEETGKWFDSEGPRDSPAPNYWRQSMDEREYKKDMDVVEAALLCFDVDEQVTALEKRRTVRFPFKSRKILGTWAPILNAGEKVVYDDKPMSSNDGFIECSLLIEILRPGGPKYGEKHRYGTFFASLEEGEEVVIRSSDWSIDTTFRASKEQTVQLIGDACAGSFNSPIYLGSITYLSDYLLIQRREDGKIDLWMRACDSHLGI